MIGPILGGAARMRFNSAETNIVFDGNSLVFGAGSTGGQSLTVQLAAKPPINGQLSIVNLGVNGQNISQMRSADDDVDAAFVMGKKNLLGFWEATNSLNYGGSVSAAYSGTVGYCADRLAVHPWLIFLVTALPRRNQGFTQEQTNAYNAKLDEYNALILANYKAMGAVAVVDVRKAGSPFALTDYTTPSFQAVGPYWASEGDMHVHLNNAGYGLIAEYIAQELRRIKPD